MPTKQLDYREIDWITAPGDRNVSPDCDCPPPACSDSCYYISSMWIETTGTITIEEVASPGSDPDSVSVAEREFMQRWAFQVVKHELGTALKQAERDLSTETTPVRLKSSDVTLSANAIRLMSATFKIRADRVTGTNNSSMAT